VATQRNGSHQLEGPGPGRPPGLKNRTTREAKAIIEGCVDRMGGIDRLYQWAMKNNDNETAFWTRIFIRLLPLRFHGAMTDEEGDVSAEAAKRRLEQLFGNNGIIDVTPRPSGKNDTRAATGRGRQANGG
jgi:hypothetical protein